MKIVKNTNKLALRKVYVSCLNVRTFYWNFDVKPHSRKCWFQIQINIAFVAYGLSSNWIDQWIMQTETSSSAPATITEYLTLDHRLFCALFPWPYLRLYPLYYTFIIRQYLTINAQLHKPSTQVRILQEFLQY